MKTIRRKYKRRITSRYKNKKSKKCRQSIRQKKCKTKKVYHYRRNNRILYQSGGEYSDDEEDEEDTEDLYDGGEEPATQEDIKLAIDIIRGEPHSPRGKAILEELYRYRGYDPATGGRCMEYPSKNTLFGKVLEEQYALNFFKKYFPDTRREMFAAYLQLVATAEHDIPSRLTNGMGDVSIKSKRIGNKVGKKKKEVTIDSPCSFQICSADAVRFVGQILGGQPLTLVIIYYNIETPGKVIPDKTIRVYKIDSQLDAIWGGYRTPKERQDLEKRIRDLSILFTRAQDSGELETIERETTEIKRQVKELQVEMKKKRTLFSLAPKISSKVGKELKECKHQCRLQAVLNVRTLEDADQIVTDLMSPTSFPLSKNAASLGFGRPSARGASAKGASAKGASAKGASARSKPEPVRLTAPAPTPSKRERRPSPAKEELQQLMLSASEMPSAIASAVASASSGQKLKKQRTPASSSSNFSINPYALTFSPPKSNSRSFQFALPASSSPAAHIGD
jgi:hypothetical protein